MYEVRIGRRAVRQLRDLLPAARKRVAEVIDRLASEPRPGGAKKLEATCGLWPVRVGAYRIVYSIEDDRLLVLVVRVGPRRDIYRGL